MKKYLLVAQLSCCLLYNSVAQKIDAGSGHALMICNTGEVKAFGTNSNGQVGDNTTTNASIPVSVLNVSNAEIVSAGFFHSLAVTSTGELWVWGANFNGQIGNEGVATKYIQPVSVLTSVMHASAGNKHTLAVKSDGTVWAWGDNSKGQLGIGSLIPSDTNKPQQVVGLSNVKMVAGGTDFSLALTNDGKVYAWGANDRGQLGDSSTVDRLTPVLVKNLDSIVEISAGELHSLALESNGNVMAFGDNLKFQASGGGSDKDSVPAVATCGMVKVNAGSTYSYAIDSSGAAYSWGGSNSTGLTGLGNTDLTNIYPEQKMTIISGKITEIALYGSSFAIAATDDGKLYSWGANTSGLGDGTSTDSKTATVEVTSGITLDTYIPLISIGECAPTSYLPMTAYNGVAIPVPGRVEGEEYGEGGEGAAYHDSAPGLEGGAITTRPGDDVEMSLNTRNSGHHIGWGETGEWLRYVVDVTKVGTFDLVLNYASDPGQWGGGGALNVKFQNQGIDENFTFGPTASWTDFVEITISNIDFTVLGSDTMILEITDNGFNIDYIEVVGDSLIGILENNNSLSSVYPNPVVDQLRLELSEQSDITITNLIGEVVSSFTANKGLTNYSVEELNITQQGIYFVKVSSTNNQQLHKIIKN